MEIENGILFGVDDVAATTAAPFVYFNVVFSSVSKKLRNPKRHKLNLRKWKINNKSATLVVSNDWKSDLFAISLEMICFSHIDHADAT